LKMEHLTMSKEKAEALQEKAEAALREEKAKGACDLK
jgi:hypothetical protein